MRKCTRGAMTGRGAPATPASGVNTNRPDPDRSSRHVPLMVDSDTLASDVDRRSARRGDDGEAEADRAVGIRERQTANGGGSRRTALIVGAFEAIVRALLHDRQRHDVAIRPQLPAKCADRLNPPPSMRRLASTRTPPSSVQLSDHVFLLTQVASPAPVIESEAADTLYGTPFFRGVPQPSRVDARSPFQDRNVAHAFGPARGHLQAQEHVAESSAEAGLQPAPTVEGSQD